MPKKRPISRKIGNHTKEQMKEALQEIESGKKIRAVARDKRIPFSTLQRYAVKVKASKSTENVKLVPNYDVNRVFTDEQEQALTEYYKNCALMFYGLTTKDCRKVAYEMAVINKIKMPQSWIVNQMAGIDWLKSFRKRHNELSLRKPEACSLARATAFNKETVKVFFDNLQEVYKRHSAFADGTRVYNLDETATVTVQKPQKVIGPKGKNIGKVTSGEKGTLVTTCCIISAAGQALPPVLIFPRKNYKDHMIKGAPPGTLGLATPSGWMNSELFVDTIKHFIKNTSSSKENPSILIMDNHESHLCIEALDIAKENGVTILTLHPHTSAKLQPLDVGIYSPFKSYYNAAMELWLLNNPGKGVTIYDLAELIGTAFIRTMTPTNIINAFKKTGIHPFDRNVFTEEDFLPSAVTDRPNPNVPQNSLNVSFQDISEIEQNSPTILEKETLLGPSVNSPTFQQEPEHDSRQEPLESQREQPQEPPKPQCSKSKDTSLLSGGFVSPSQFRQPLKAMPRANIRRRRKPGRSLIATDTPEKENIRLQRSEIKKRKLPKQNNTNKPNKKAVRKILQSESEDDAENFSLDDEDSDWCEEDEVEDEIEILTDQKLQLNVLPRVLKEEDYVLVRFSTKRKSIYFVGKVLQDRNENLEYYVSFLRVNRKYQFHMPSNPDLSYVKECDVKLILPKPCVGGSTLRQQSYYYFNVDFSQIDIR
ncbi:uncharacterized protein LOC123865623 [Maniola jurtina]|uniref:uncharacterized protein LOC123865623 n=1 Tax=Maniola jurtina TaxID=191418 RepID=UPI001E688C6B|nr:uncharacterized protein LOC123865623 [Maniola jurtina]